MEKWGGGELHVYHQNDTHVIVGLQLMRQEVQEEELDDVEGGDAEHGVSLRRAPVEDAVRAPVVLDEERVEGEADELEQGDDGTQVLHRRDSSGQNH